jgi:predicted Zn-dependent peptidase
MKINWKKGPGYKRIEEFAFPTSDKTALSNGIPVSLINMGTQEIVRLDIVFRGARLLESKKMASKITSALMREGTKTYVSGHIAESVDYYGSALRTGANLDYTFLSLSGLSRHFEKLLPVIEEILYDPIFPQAELEKYKKTNIEKLQLDLSKNELVNYRIFTENLYGQHHPYGYNTEEKFITAIHRDDLLEHHQHAYGNNHCFMLLGGKINDQMVVSLDRHLGQQYKNAPTLNNPPIETKAGHNKILVPSKNKHQSSIKIGRRLFNRHHEDFAGFYVLNTILGGYFGSRLMTSIREEQGLTYNIYSVIDHLIFDGYFYIETEVATGTEEKAIEEIYKQMDILQNEAVNDAELQMVKNYLLGNFLNLIDGPLNVMSFLRSLELDFADRLHFENFIQEILSIDATSIMHLAKKYLIRNTMLEVIVGGNESTK